MTYDLPAEINDPEWIVNPKVFNQLLASEGCCGENMACPRKKPDPPPTLIRKEGALFCPYCHSRLNKRTPVNCPDCNKRLQ